MNNNSKVLATCTASLFGILTTSKTNTISKSLSYIEVNGITTTFLIDTFSYYRYVDKKFFEKNIFTIQNYMGEISLAETSVKMRITD